MHVLKVGQIMRFKVEAPVDCYLALVDVADGEPIKLFPNDKDLDNRLKAGVPRLVPEERVVKAEEPSAEEHVYFIASVRPLRLPEGQKIRGLEISPARRRRASCSASCASWRPRTPTTT
jgi:hypothetical protein